jgi:hypothetical protein
MDPEMSKKMEDVTMEQFVIRDPKETENEYRVRVWKSRELWDYVQIDWKYKDIDKKQYMMKKMLKMKKRVYSFELDKIDKEIKDTIYNMGQLDLKTEQHLYVWSQYYIEYLNERKIEFQMEVGMKRCRI